MQNVWLFGCRKQHILLAWLWPCTKWFLPLILDLGWSLLEAPPGLVQSLRTSPHFLLTCLMYLCCLCVIVFAILCQQFPDRSFQTENPPVLLLVEMHCARCNRWLLTSLQNSSHSREKPDLRCINVDYPQARGNVVCNVLRQHLPEVILGIQRP